MNEGRWVETNNRSEMPRSYKNSRYALYGVYYGWYAATAESGKFKTVGTPADAPDSLCPKGWDLPIAGDRDTNKSWAGLIRGSYGLSSSNAPIVRRLPLSMTLSGSYAGGGELNAIGVTGRYYTASRSSAINATRLVLEKSSYTINNMDKTNGQTVRCIKDGTSQ